MRRVVFVGLCVGLFAIGCQEKKAQPSGEESSTSSATAGAQSAPGKKGAGLGNSVMTQAAIEARVEDWARAVGCQDRADDPLCTVALKYSSAEEVKLPAQDVVMLGLSVFLADTGEFAPDGVKGRVPVALGLGERGAIGLTRIFARDPKNQQKIDGLTRQVDQVVRGVANSNQVVVHDDRLLSYIAGQPKTASVELSPQGARWKFSDRIDGELSLVAGRWVTVHRETVKPDGDRGVWLTVYSPVKLSGAVALEEELPLDKLASKLGCDDQKVVEQAKRRCEAVEQFAQAKSLREVVADGEVGLFLGDVYAGFDGEDGSVGAAHIRRSGEDLEIAFSQIIAQSGQEQSELDGLLAAVRAKKAAPSGNAALGFIMSAREQPSAWGEAATLDEGSAVVARTGLFRSAPGSRTVTYFRSHEDRVLAITRDHLSGKVWFWQLASAKVPVEK